VSNSVKPGRSVVSISRDDRRPALPWGTAPTAPPGAGNPSTLPDPVARLAQRDAELDLHLAGAVVGHRVVDRVELRQQAQPVFAHEAVRLDAGLVAIEAQVGVEPGHADIDAGFAEHVLGAR